MRKSVAAAVVLVGGLFMLSLYQVLGVATQALGVAVDNALGIRTGADIERVKSQRIGDRTVGDLVGPSAEWTARHAEELWRTFVECRVVHGGEERVYNWEVTHGYSPRASYAHAQGIFITPLTRTTASLAPELVHEGIRSALPERLGMCAAAIYQSAGIAPPPVQPEWVPVAREVHAPSR